MPCNTIQRSQVQFLATSTDAALLADGLRALGYSIVPQAGEVVTFYRNGLRGSYNRETGQLTIPESWDGNEIKRAYSEQVVTTQAVRNGWKVQWTTNKEGRREATVQKRG